MGEIHDGKSKKPSTCCQKLKDFFSFTKPGATKPPWKIIFLLYFSLFGSAFSITFLFPFLPDMILHFGYAESEKGYYAGLVASGMFAGRIFGSYFWGWISDLKGRKVVLIVSLVLIGLSNLAFGFSTNITWAIVTRFFCGLVNGVVGIIKTVVYEVSDSSNQAVGMSILSLAWGSGVIVGPLISGYIAQPATKYPDVFGASGFLIKYPFFLPGLVAMVLAMSPIPAIWFRLPETNIGATTTVEIIGNGEVPKTKSNSPMSLRLPVNKENPSKDIPVIVLADADTPDGPEPQTYLSFKGGTSMVPQEITAFDPLCDDIVFMDDEDKEDYQLMSGIGCPSLSVPDVRVRTATPTPSLSPLQKNTLYDEPEKCNHGDQHDVSSKQLLDDSAIAMHDTDEKEDRKCCRGCRENGIVEMLSIRDIRLTVAIYTVFSFALVGFEEVFTVWASTQVEYSGLGFSAEQIGKALGLSSLPLITLQIFVFPKIEAKIGVIKTFAVFNCFLIVLTVGLVCLRPLHNNAPALWGLLLLFMGVQKMSAVSCFSCVSILINNSVAPSMAGSVNGLGNTFTAIGRTMGPTFGGSIFAWSITHGTEVGFPFDVNLIFILFSLVYVSCAIICAFLPEYLNRQTKKPVMHEAPEDVPEPSVRSPPVPQPSLSQLRLNPAICRSVTSLAGGKQLDNESLHSYIGD